MLNLMQRYNNFLIYANFRYEKWEILSKKIKNWAKKRTWMCAQRRYRKKKTQDTISGNGQRWAGGKAEYDSDAIDKMKLKREPDDSRLICSAG